MNNESILSILKMDLKISASQYDEYLNNLIELSKAAIKKEGIILDNSIEDGMLVEMYAAYLYRKRKEESNGMPRMLRYALNNRLFSQKARVD